MNMKKLLKRYQAFLILLGINLLLVFVLPETGKAAFSITTDSFMEMLAVIPPIFVLLGLLDIWVDRTTMMKYTGKGSGLKGMLIAFLLGSAAAGPLYTAFPIASVMLKKGSSVFHVMIFIGAWSATKIPMLTFEATNLGLRFMLIRLGLSVAGILLIALLTDRSLSSEEKTAIFSRNQ